jgi:hypothetical protein
MPPPPPPPAPAAAFSGLSAMTASVVRKSAGDGRGVLQRRAGDLRRVDDARGDHVDVLTGRGVEAPAGFLVANLLDHDAALEAGVDRDLLERRLERELDDVGTRQLVTGQVELLERRGRRLQQRDTTTGDDALLDGSLRVADGVLDAVLALLELDLGGRADLDDRDAAGQLGQPLLQLLAVVVGVALLDLGADLVDPAVDLVGVTGSVDDGRLVLGDDHLAGLAEQVDAGVLQLQADVSLMTWPPVRMAMSASMALRRSPKPGALTATT